MIMVILEDTRQQEGKHKIKHRWFLDNGITWDRHKLIVGDYQLPGSSAVAVDTKFSIQELIGDIQVKAMSKKDTQKNVEDEIGLLDGFDDDTKAAFARDIFHLICDDDSDRNPESQIKGYCYLKGIPDKSSDRFLELYEKRHGFFHRGLVRAKQYGTQLYVLVDNTDGIKTVRDLFSWVNPRRLIMVKSKIIVGYYPSGNPKYKKVQKYPNCMSGGMLAKACLTMQAKYGARFVFCHPQESGQIIMDILTGNYEWQGE